MRLSVKGSLCVAVLGVATLLTPGLAQAAPQCTADDPSASSCRNSYCHDFEVTQDAVQCVDNPLPPMLVAAPRVEVELGFAAGS